MNERKGRKRRGGEEEEKSIDQKRRRGDRLGEEEDGIGKEGRENRKEEKSIV